MLQEQIKWRVLVSKPVHKLMTRFRAVVSPFKRLLHRTTVPEDASPRPSSQPPQVPHHSKPPGNSDPNTQFVITHIQATDVLRGFRRRLPVGFFITAQAGHTNQKTTSKPISVHDDIVQWDDEIIFPNDPSSRVRLAVCATLEAEPEAFYTLEIRVGELLDLSGKMQAITFFPSSGEVESPCSLLFVILERRTCDWYEAPSGASLVAHDSDIRSGSRETVVPVQLTDNGHEVVLKYKNTVHGPPSHRLHKVTTTTTKLRDTPLQALHHYSHNYIMEDIVRCIPNATHDQREMLVGLAISFPEEMEQSIPLLEGVFQCIPNNHPIRWGLAFNLGSAFLCRFDRLGQITDIDRSILVLQEAAELARHNELDRAQVLSRLGISLVKRFEHLSRAIDINQAIIVFEEVLQLIPIGHPDRPGKLSDLSIAFLRCFEHFHTITNLDKSASLMLEVVELTPDDHPDKQVRLYILGASFKARFQRLGNAVDLDKSILVEEESLRLIPTAHRDRLQRLMSLHSLLMLRFQRIGHIADLDKSMVLREEVLQFIPEDLHGVRIGWRLASLAETSLARFLRLGDRMDLDMSISMGTEALRSIPKRYAASPLGCLGTAFLMRFQLLGDLADLYQSIPLLEQAVKRTPNNHGDRSALLLNFGISLTARFEQHGNITDVDNSILVKEEALRLIPADRYSYNKPAVLSTLGASYIQRFEHLGDLADLEKAISMMEEGARVAPNDHIERPRILLSLGSSLIRCFECLGNPADLDNAVATLEKALQLMPDQHSLRSSTLFHLAVSFQQRFMLLGNISDLDRSITLAKEATNPNPTSRHSRALPLVNLGVSLLNRFIKLGEEADIAEATSVMEEALRLIPKDHPTRPAVNIELGSLLVTRFQRLDDLQALDAAISRFSDAACSSIGPLPIRFKAAKRWIQHSFDSQHHSLLEAYECALNLLPRFTWIKLSFKDRYRELLGAAEITRNAATAAISLGHTRRAVEWLEQGRSIVWGQLLQLRTPLDKLRRAHPDLADQLGWLSNALEQSSSADDQSSVQLVRGQNGLTESADGQAQRYREQVFEREKLLEQIRALPGFERFLLPKKYSQLRDCARSGPVIFLNANTLRVDALVIVAELEKPMHIPLMDITNDHAEHLAALMKKSVATDGRVISREDRAARLAVQGGHGFDYILAELWTKIVRPILRALGLLKTRRRLSRVFWCPTGSLSFLPIHAAGIYDRPGSGNKASDFVISSYVPTLGVLSPSRQRNVVPGHVHLLAVSQPTSDGQAHLSGAPREIDYIKQTANSSSHVTLRESSGIVEKVLDGMEKSDWVHFACHGVQDVESPTDSGLCLADKHRLRLSDIIRLSRPAGGLAFLSACQTATGDAELSEEAVHLAAGMLFAGYGSVIGTMWSIRDSVAPELAKDVYEQLFRDGRIPDCREAAEALHDAVERLRQRGEPFIAWVPFIHIGL